MGGQRVLYDAHGRPVVYPYHPVAPGQQPNTPQTETTQTNAPPAGGVPPGGVSNPALDDAAAYLAALEASNDHASMRSWDILSVPPEYTLIGMHILQSIAWMWYCITYMPCMRQCVHSCCKKKKKDKKEKENENEKE